MNEKLIGIAALTGLFGDAFLQIMVKNGWGNYGLKSYFTQHGQNESIFIAAGMMAVFYTLYLFILKPNWIFLSIYAVCIDFVFRKLRIFPSLDGYYNHFGYLTTAIWAIIPMLIPYFINYFINRFIN